MNTPHRTNYDPYTIETAMYQIWQDANMFAAGRQATNPVYTIVIPPPNVTGSLHLGHALDNSLQDILCRYKRMRGYDVLWQPGTDHAGIATQMVVERQLLAQNINRHDLGRDAFIEKVWQWKDESGGQIIHQLKRLGASCDWSRERFTMDEGLSKAVITFFVSLYENKYIYRDKRLVNWDPKLLTAISDLEVVQKEVKGHYWHIRYPLKKDPQRYIVVATTRPETLLGDMAVAVSEEDPRYQDIIGENVLLPLTDREIPIIADIHANPEQGSGAVKITPSHDFNDFEVAKRHNLPQMNILTADGRINDNAPKDFVGLDRYEARDKIVSQLEKMGLLDKVEDIVHHVPYGDRSQVVIEPYLTDQWYVDTKELAKKAIEVVENGDIRFVPENWKKTYFEWMHNIQPWCISRQLWWGHRIPAWYGPDGHVFVAENEAMAYTQAHDYYRNKDIALTRDEDVLDTWFSSALWPFSTMGWPDDTASLQRYYPTDVLVTGFDIIFFWVARMIMAGLYCTQRAPFHTVYIHALIRDADGQKMSKSKGNVINPLDIIDAYGADALRFTLAALSSQGRDIRLNNEKVESYRNFITKIWNMFRFCDMNAVFDNIHTLSNTDLTPRYPHNVWILGHLNEVIHIVTHSLETYRFNDAAHALYKFIWRHFCDWYVELSKPILSGEDIEAAQETRQTLAFVAQTSLKLLHPFIPFVTEKLWQDYNFSANIATHRACKSNSDTSDLAHITCLMAQEWPEQFSHDHNNHHNAVAQLIDIIGEIRATRSSLNVPAGAYIDITIDTSEVKKTASSEGESIDFLMRDSCLAASFVRLVRAHTPQFTHIPPSRCVRITHHNVHIYLALGEHIDIDAEIQRMQKQLTKTVKEREAAQHRLSNNQFLAKAPHHVVEELNQKLVMLDEKEKSINITLKQLESLKG